MNFGILKGLYRFFRCFFIFVFWDLAFFGILKDLVSLGILNFSGFLKAFVFQVFGGFFGFLKGLWGRKEANPKGKTTGRWGDIFPFTKPGVF